MSEKDADEIQSRLRVMFSWCTAGKHETHKPLLCVECNEWQPRLDKHLQRHKKHQGLDWFDREKIIKEARQRSSIKKVTSDSVTSSSKVNKTIINDNAPSGSESADSEDEVFTRRAKNIQSEMSSQFAADYIPDNAIRLSDDKRKE